MLSSVGLVMNRANTDAVKCAGKAASILRGHGIDAYEMEKEKKKEPAGMIISFGGDGTLLRAAGYAVENSIPLLGINLGTVGFLTEEEPSNLEATLRALMEGRFDTEERSLLRIQVPHSGDEYYALNDAVITRGGYARLIKVDVFVNGKIYGVFTADGIIVATPTGSTGYSLSAGGPIVSPDMNCMILTPVCAHSMQQCPCVVSESSHISLRLNPSREQTAELQVDGQNRMTLNKGHEILVTGTDKKIRLIRMHNYDFFNVMRHKLVEWGS